MSKAKAKTKQKATAKKAAPKKLSAKKVSPKKPAAKKAVNSAAKKSAAPKASTKKVVARQAVIKKAAAKIAWADFFSPLGNRVLIEREEAPTKTAGGLFIPDFAQERPNHARVLVAGPGSRSEKGRLQPLDVKVGDRVLLSSYAGTQIKLQGHDLMLVREDEIQAILP